MPNLTIQSRRYSYSQSDFLVVSLGKGEAIQASNYTEDAAMKYGEFSLSPSRVLSSCRMPALSVRLNSW